jgi:hypothetical protein
MAIETVIGRVEYLKIGRAEVEGHPDRDYGLVSVRIENTTVSSPNPPNELLIIWIGDQSYGPKALFTTELSMALSRGLRVRVTLGEDSAFIRELIVEAPFEGPLV